MKNTKINKMRIHLRLITFHLIIKDIKNGKKLKPLLNKEIKEEKLRGLN